MKIIKLRLNSNIKQNSVLLLMGGFCILLLLMRAKLTDSVFYFFLIWNLFLAYLPLSITSFIIDRPQLIEKRWFIIPAFFVWLLVLPNAPYIITDFFHLKRETAVPVWFDVLLLISFSITGLLFGLKSMRQMFYILASQFNYIMVWISIYSVCILTGSGIYIGRFLRYNSWDVLHKPLEMISIIYQSLTTRPECITAWGITLGFGTFLFLLFLMQPNLED